MMTLDEQVLKEARDVRQRLVDLESQTDHARVDYHHAIKKLHAAGGSLREIAEALELSHQRVHQIVEGAVDEQPGGRRWSRRRGWAHGRRQFFMARFDESAQELMVEAQKEADSLKHGYVGTEHMMLAAVRRGAVAVSFDDARKQVVERIGEGDQQWIAGMPRPLTPRAKRVLERALGLAADAGREQFSEADIVLSMVEDPRGAGGEILRGFGVIPEQLREQLGR